MAVTGDAGGLVAELVPDLRFSVASTATRGGPALSARAAVGDRGGAPICVRCARCAGVHVESLPWVSGKQQMTRALLVLRKDVGPDPALALFRCSWGTVGRRSRRWWRSRIWQTPHWGRCISRKRDTLRPNVYDLARILGVERAGP